MSDKQPDPAEVFRNLVTEWERGFDAMANKIMGTEEFSRSMNQFQDLQLNMQKRFNEAMAEQLSTFNVPSRDDILRLGESIRGLDKRLSKIEMLLAKQSKKGGKGKKGKKKHGGPPRTKQPPSAQREQTDE
jgi:hypothetical protein